MRCAAGAYTGPMRTHNHPPRWQASGGRKRQAICERGLVRARTGHADELLLSALWKGGAIRVAKEFEANLPLVPLDESLSEQAFVNVIQNAYDAMGEAGGSLRVRVTRSQRNGHDGVEVRIEDSGPGIPKDLREQIFNPFMTTKKTGGMRFRIVKAANIRRVGCQKPRRHHIA